jgi:hypothetical protein
MSAQRRVFKSYHKGRPTTSIMDCDDWLTPPTVPPVVCAGTGHHWPSDSTHFPSIVCTWTAESIFCYINTMCGCDTSHQPLMMETRTGFEAFDTSFIFICLILRRLHCIILICLSLQNPKRNESQAMLSWCLEAASGFYLTLLQEICTAFDLDLPFRR